MKKLNITTQEQINKITRIIHKYSITICCYCDFVLSQKGFIEHLFKEHKEELSKEELNLLKEVIK